jgi:hypothetical protein
MLGKYHEFIPEPILSMPFVGIATLNKVFGTLKQRSHFC